MLQLFDHDDARAFLCGGTCRGKSGAAGAHDDDIAISFVVSHFDPTIGNSILPRFARWVDGSGLQHILRRRASLP
jgi:hypothetical protein